MLILKMETVGGETITDTCSEMIRLATDLKCEIVVNFNGVMLHADYTGKVETLKENYFSVLHDNTTKEKDAYSW